MHLPMPGRRAGGKAGPLGVYSLGVFSGIASSCCAPVLAGVIALSGVASSFALALGLGTAYVTGFKYAIEHKYDYVFEMDADFSHDPDEIPNFLRKIEVCDLVIGSRYTNGVRVLNWPIQRLLLSYFANVYTRVVTGLPVHDATGGFKCYRRNVLEAIDLDKIRSNGYAFQIEMSFKVWRKGFRIEEIPIIFLDRRSGVSKMSKNIVYEAMFVLWKLKIRSILNRL
ncbi:MAG: glycosyltransferase [Ignavibacteriae bacterium]|nr:glycosyltransferase [Ignavibacteriota bacterium]